MSRLCYQCFHQIPDTGHCPFCGYDPDAAQDKYPLALMPGIVLAGRYLIGRVLGQGGFGITYLALDNQTRSRVAVKEYLPVELALRNQGTKMLELYSADRRENFENGKQQFIEEARTLSQFIGNEHIVNVQRCFESNGTAYFVMEYMEGVTLKQHMQDLNRPLTVYEANRILLPIMEALDWVHSKGVVHRDISPDNIMIRKDGNAKLIDFGAARYSTGEMSKSLDVVLKHGFAPKEQYTRRGRQGPFTDVYAIAATYYYAITGKVPPDAIERTDEDTLIPPSKLGVQINPTTEAALLKALSVQAQDRYQSIMDFYDAMMQSMPSPYSEDGSAEPHVPGIAPLQWTRDQNKRSSKLPLNKSTKQSQSYSPDKSYSASQGYSFDQNYTPAQPSTQAKAQRKKSLLPLILLSLLLVLGVVAVFLKVTSRLPTVKPGQVTSVPVESVEPTSVLTPTSAPKTTPTPTPTPTPKTTPADVEFGPNNEITLDVIICQYGPNTNDWFLGKGMDGSNFVEKFEAANPGIKLNLDVVSWNDVYTEVDTRIANDNAPDILNIDVFANYAHEGLLMPVKDYCPEDLFGDFFPSFIDQSVFDGTVWALPDLASARALFYNVDIFNEIGEEAPTTWAELREVSQAILDYYDGNIYPWGIDMTTDEGQAAFAYYTWGNGGGFVDANGDWAVNSPENVEAIEYAVSLVNDGYTNPNPAMQTRYDLQDMFAAGKLAMVIAPNQLPTYVAYRGGNINIGTAKLPAKEGKTSSSIAVMDRIVAFKDDSSSNQVVRNKAIGKFLEFFYDAENYNGWVSMEGFLPAVKSALVTLAETDPTFEAWLDILSDCRFYPAAKTEWSQVKRGVIDAEQNALVGADVQTALNALQAELVE